MAINDDAIGGTAALDETWRGLPSSAEPLFQGQERIRSTRSKVAALLSEEHEIDGADIGKHVEGSARVFVGSGGAFGDGTTPDSAVGRVRFDDATNKMEVQTSDGWKAVEAAYPGLISYSAVIPVPATDGWILCDGNGGNPLTWNADDSTVIYKRLIQRLAGPGATSAYIPDLRNRFIRGHDTMASGSGRTINNQSTATAPDNSDGVSTGAFNFQKNTVKDHKHAIDHTHPPDIETSQPVWNNANQGPNPGGDTSFINGVLNTDDGNWWLALVGAVATSRRENIAIDLNHKHTVTVPAYDGDSGLVVGTDGAAMADHVSAENRPDNIALYVVMKL